MGVSAATRSMPVTVSASPVVEAPAVSPSRPPTPAENPPLARPAKQPMFGDESALLLGLKAPKGRSSAAPAALAPVAPQASTPQPGQQLTVQAAPTVQAVVPPQTEGNLLHPIHEMRRIIEPTYDRIMRYVGVAITGPLTFIRWLATLVLNFVSMVVRTILSFIVELPIRALGIFGIDVTRAIDIARKVVAVPFGILTGVVEGALRAPEALVGSVFNFVRDLASLRWIRQPELLLQTFVQPMIGAFTAVISPIFYTVRGIDDAIYPPRSLTEQEREALLRDYPADVLDSVRLHDRGILHALMWGDAGAQTIGNDIYLRNKKPGGESTIDTLRHELVHTTQVVDTAGGTPAFVAEYYSHLIGNLTAVPSGTDRLVGAYFAIPYESEAYALGGGLEHAVPAGH